MLYIGIDPGVSGGIAAVRSDGSVYFVCRMPATAAAILEALKIMRPSLGNLHKATAVLERVNSFAPAGRRMGATSAMTFGKSVGHLEMGLEACGFAYASVVPQKWQAAIGLSYPKDSTQTERKNLGKAFAAFLYPQLTVTHAIADALLIAEYGRRLALAVVPTSASRIPNGKETEGGKSRKETEGGEGRSRTTRDQAAAGTAARRHAVRSRTRSLVPDDLGRARRD